MDTKKILTLDDLMDSPEKLPGLHELLEPALPPEAPQTAEIPPEEEIRERPEPPAPLDLKSIKKVYSRIGWSLCAIFALVVLAQAIIIAITPTDSWLLSSSTGTWLITFVPQYLLAMPVGLWLMKKLPTEAPTPVSMGKKNFWIFLAIGFFLTYTGSFLGNFLAGSLSDGSADNLLDAYTMDTNPIKVLFLVILAPLFEELVFRKAIIDRTRIYGEKMAVFLSAITFGLFHMNMYQFVYAFLLGGLYGYIYIRTGKLKYTVIMHGITNFVGGVIAPMVLSMVDLDVLASLENQDSLLSSSLLTSEELISAAVYYGYVLMLLAVWIIGLVFFIKRVKRLVWKEVSTPLPANKRINTVFVNAGMLTFLILFSLLTLSSIAA